MSAAQETPTAWCGGCNLQHAVDAHWRAFWIDSDHDLRITQPLIAGVAAYDRAGYVLVCGQGSALRVTERFLHTGSLDSTFALHPFHSQFD